MEEKIYLSVIIPAYNEKARIKNTLLEIDKFLTTPDYNYEIIVVDDGSRDGMVKLVKILQESIKNLKIISNQKNYGKGYAVRQGLLKARGKFRLFMAAFSDSGYGAVLYVGIRRQKKSASEVRR